MRSLQEFQRGSGESLREAYTRMWRLISVTKGVTEAQAVQFWYGILDRDLRRRVRDVTLMSDEEVTLAVVFALSERIELKLVEEKVVVVGFSRDTPFSPSTSSRSPSSTPPQRSGRGAFGGGGGRGGVGRPSPGARVERTCGHLPSFAGQQQGVTCWTCGGNHLRKDCLEGAMSTSS